MNAPETAIQQRSVDASGTALRVLALDPGKTTGYCYAALRERTLLLSAGQWDESLSYIYNALDRFVDIGHNKHIIYEDFSYRSATRTGLDLTPVKIIGVIELYREWHEPFVGFHKQSAATGKAFYSDDKLKDLGAYTVGKQHGRDATRHLLQWANFGAGSAFMNLRDLTIEQVELRDILYYLQS